MRLIRAPLPAVIAVALVLSAGCASTAPAGESSAHPEGTPSAPSRAAVPASVTKLLVFVVENHSFDQMRAEMPWTFSLAERYGYADHYTALAHPSLPNYLAMVGGDTFGIGDDLPPSAHPVPGQSVFGQALATGGTARLYAEGMPGTCSGEDGGERYGVRHNPWPYFVDERSQCGTDDVSLDGFAADVAAGDLPDAGMVIPDVCNDGHDCDLSVTDGWMRDVVGEAMSGPDWESGHLAIVITADEDYTVSGNRVLTTVAHPSLDGVVVHDAFTHYSLTRMYDEVLGVPLLRGAAEAPSMVAAFGLAVGGR